MKTELVSDLEIDDLWSTFPSLLLRFAFGRCYIQYKIGWTLIVIYKIILALKDKNNTLKALFWPVFPPIQSASVFLHTPIQLYASITYWTTLYDYLLQLQTTLKLFDDALEHTIMLWLHSSTTYYAYTLEYTLRLHTTETLFDIILRLHSTVYCTLYHV